MQWITLENKECGVVKRFVRASQVNKIIHLGCATYSTVFLVEKLTLQVEEDSKPECRNTPTIEGDLSLSLSFFLSFSLSLSQSYPQIVNSSTFLFFISLVF
jgi:hypothetical protein